MAHTLKISSSGSGDAIVFIHGWGLNSGVWQPIVEQLVDKYRVITIDLPGFGMNHDVTLPAYTLENVVAKVAEVLPEQAIIVGWSLGGLIATQLALNYTNKVKALVSVASSPCFVEQDNWPGIKPEVLTGFYTMLAKDSQKTIENFLKIQAMGSESVRQDVKKIRQLIMQYPMADQNTLANSLAILENTDLRGKVNDITVPTLRLYGRLDSLVPKAIIEKVLLLTNQRDSVIFEQASHAPFISHEKAFIETLIFWLEKSVK